MSANSLLLMGGPSLWVSSRLSSLRHQRDQQGGSRVLRKRSNCPNHQARVRCPTKFSSSQSGLSAFSGEGTVP